MRRLVVVLLVTLSSLTGGAAATAAEPVLHYDGQGTISSFGPTQSSGPVTINFTLDCTAQPCTLTGVASQDGDVGVITGATPLPLDHGEGSYPIAALGDVCTSDVWIGPGDLVLTITATEITFNRSVGGSGEVDCGSSTNEWDPGAFTGAIAYTSGDFCTFESSCEAPTVAKDTIRLEGPATAVYPDFPDADVTTTAWAELDCSADPCLLTMGTNDFDGPVVTSGDALAFTAPSESYELGELCTDTGYIGAGTLDVALQDDTMTFTRTSAAGDCAGVSYTEFTLTSAMVVVGGDECALNASCLVAAIIPVAGNGPEDPSVLSALTTPAEAVEPANILWAAAVAVVLVLLVAFPTHLLNSAIEHGTGRVGAWWRKRRPARALKPRNGWPLAAAGVLAASVISSFVSPDFGLNGASIRVFLSILLSFVLDAIAGWFIVIWLVKRANPGAKASFTFAPLTLLVVIAAVVFTRVTGFQPGIVFGLVAGVTFGAVLATSGKAKTTLISLGYGFGLAVLAWIGYGLLEGAEGAPLVFLRETLSSLAIGGIAALPIALIPLRGLSGYDVFRWKRWVWITAYAIGLVGFFLVLMPRPFSWAEVPLSIGAWIGIYLAYAAVAVGLWLALVRPWKKSPSS